MIVHRFHFAAKELSCHGEKVASYETSHEKFEPQYGLDIIQRCGDRVIGYIRLPFNDGN